MQNYQQLLSFLNLPRAAPAKTSLVVDRSLIPDETSFKPEYTVSFSILNITIHQYLRVKIFSRIGQVGQDVQKLAEVELKRVLEVV